MAVSLPKGGEMTLSTVPEKKYQSITISGPLNPRSSESFREKSTMSKTGFEKLE
jgi:hypothetical protein